MVAKRKVPLEELTPDDFEMGKLLGRGAQATVFLAKYKKTGKRCVVKRVERMPESQQKALEQEVDVLMRASVHPNVVNFKGCFRDAEGLLNLVMGALEGEA